MDRRAHRRLGEVMAGLPPTVSAAIEVRLGAGAAPVDLAVRVSEAGEARAIAAGLGEGPASRFLRRWVEQPDPRVPFVWLEFDIPAGDGGAGAPLMIPRVAREARPDWLLGDLLAVLRGSPPTGPQLATLRRALDGLPRDAHCCYVFDLRPRGTEAIRLSFTDLVAKEMPAQLDRMGRPDLAAAVSKARRLVADSDRRELNFDVDDTGAIQPRVGIELSYDTWPRHDVRWQRLFDTLVDEELCLPAKRDAVLAWSGYDFRGNAPDRWPEDPLYRAAYLVRWLSHVKLVCVPDRPLEAKAYLVFGLWTRRRNGRLQEGAAGLAAARN